MSAALGRAMLARLPENNAIRNANHRLLSSSLEALGFDCFLAPTGIARVYFEFIIRHRDPSIDVPKMVAVLQEFGCRVGLPRYPLLHQQPLFTEGVWRTIGRYPEGTREIDLPALPITERENSRVLRLPNFSHPNSEALIAQYADAFREAMRRVTC